MAEALIGTVTEVVLSKVISLANDQISAVLGVKEDLRSLAKQLELIHALLSDAETRSTTNKAVGVWLQELEDAATEADDLLDDFAYEVVSKKILKGKKDKTMREHVSKRRESSLPSISMGIRYKHVRARETTVHAVRDCR